MSTWLEKVLIFVSLCLTGIGIGWLIGLSISPVVSIVITSVIGSVAAIIAALSGLNKDNDTPDQNRLDDADSLRSVSSRSPTPYPIAALVVGLVIGSYFGVQARTHNWLEPDISLEIDRWVRVGISRDQVVEEMFRHQFAEATSHIGGLVDGESRTASSEGVLFAIDANDCDNLRSRSGDELKRELATSASYPQLQKLPEIVTDVDTLQELVEEVLCPA